MNQKVSRQAIADFIAARLIAAKSADEQKRIMRSAAAYLVEHNRVSESELLINDIAHELYVQNGALSVEVTSAAALSKDAREELIEFMKKETGSKTVMVHESVDPELVGGLVARTPDAELDVSVRSKLRKLAAIA